MGNPLRKGVGKERNNPARGGKAFVLGNKGNVVNLKTKRMVVNGKKNKIRGPSTGHDWECPRKND